MERQEPNTACDHRQGSCNDNNGDEDETTGRLNGGDLSTTVEYSSTRGQRRAPRAICRSRAVAGSDNPCRRPQQQQQQQQQRARRTARRQPQPVWGANVDRALTPLRDAYRRTDGARPRPQHHPPSRIPVPRRPSPRRQDRPVEHYQGSRLPVPRRRGPAPPRLQRPAAPQRADGVPPATRQRRCTFDDERPPPSRRHTCDVRPSSATAECSRRRHSTYADTRSSARRRSSCEASQPQPQCAPVGRGTYDVLPPAPQCPPTGRGTYDVLPPAPQCPPTGRGTYDVLPQVPPCQPRGRSTYDVLPSAPDRCSALDANGGGMQFSLNGTFRVDGSGHYPGGPSVYEANSAADVAAVQHYIDNQMDEGVIAPRELAVPGTPYRHIDPMASNENTPERWRRMMDDRSSIGSAVAMSLASPADTFDTSRGSGLDDSQWSRQDDAWRPRGPDDSQQSGPDDSWRPRRANGLQPRGLDAAWRPHALDDSWRPRGPDDSSQPFGLDDSFLMLPPREGSAAGRRLSRAATDEHEYRPAARCRRRRRDTFERHTD